MSWPRAQSLELGRIVFVFLEELHPCHQAPSPKAPTSVPTTSSDLGAWRNCSCFCVKPHPSHLSVEPWAQTSGLGGFVFVLKPKSHPYHPSAKHRISHPTVTVPLTWSFVKVALWRVANSVEQLCHSIFIFVAPRWGRTSLFLSLWPTHTYSRCGMVVGNHVELPYEGFEAITSS